MLHTLRARRGMVVAPHHLAAQAGRDILRAGGNAIEAAVATAACLAVVYPHMTGIGGDGFWLIHEPDGRVHAIDACGRAAQAATLDFYRGHAHIPWRGPGAANTVAGTVSGWALALQHGGGTLPLQQLLEEAIHHAEVGVPITLGGAHIAASKGDELRCLPGAYARIFEPRGAPCTRAPCCSNRTSRAPCNGWRTMAWTVSTAARSPMTSPPTYAHSAARCMRMTWQHTPPRPACRSQSPSPVHVCITTHRPRKGWPRC